MPQNNHKTRCLSILTTIYTIMGIAMPVHAYIGNGAGIAVGVSLFAFVAVLVTIVLALLGWPLRYQWRRLRGRNAYKKARFEKVVILGFDGMDFGLTTSMLKEGCLPNFARLRDQGPFRPLATLPAISFFTTRVDALNQDAAGGEIYLLKPTDKTLIGHLQGSENPFSSNLKMLPARFILALSIPRTLIWKPPMASFAWDATGFPSGSPSHIPADPGSSHHGDMSVSAQIR